MLDKAAFWARFDFSHHRPVRELQTTPHDPAAAELVGVRASSGFRAALERALPAHRDAQSLLYLLLDDVPVATLVSGYAGGYGGIRRTACAATAGWT